MNTKSEEKRKLVYMLMTISEKLERDYANVEFENKNVDVNLELLVPERSNNLVVFYSEKEA